MEPKICKFCEGDNFSINSEFCSDECHDNYDDEHGWLIVPGQTVEKTMPHSEVCLHMRIAGKKMFVKLLNDNACQLYSLDGTPFSSPILTGEAGTFRNDDGTHYYYPNR